MSEVTLFFRVRLEAWSRRTKFRISDLVAQESFEVFTLGVRARSHSSVVLIVVFP